MTSRRNSCRRCVSNSAGTSKRKTGTDLGIEFPRKILGIERVSMTANHSTTNPKASPCVMVIFGATGDLTMRKLIPALCNLAQDELLSKQFAIIGFAGNDQTTESFREVMAEEIHKYAPKQIDLKIWDWFAERIYYVKGDLGDAEAYKRLQQQTEEVDKLHGTQGNKFFYLAVAPRFFSPIAKQL